MLPVLVSLLLVQCTILEINGEEEVSLEGRNKACDVLVAFDESLYMEHDGNMTVLVNLAKEHIKVNYFCNWVKSITFLMFFFFVGFESNICRPSLCR